MLKSLRFPILLFWAGMIVVGVLRVGNFFNNLEVEHASRPCVSVCMRFLQVARTHS